MKYASVNVNEVCKYALGGETGPLTRLSLKVFSFTARLFQRRMMWSGSFRIFRASGAAKGTDGDTKTTAQRLESEDPEMTRELD